MGLDNCVLKIKKASKEKLTDKQAKKLLTEIGKRFDLEQASISEIDAAIAATVQRAENLKKTRKINALKDFQKRSDHFEGIKQKSKGFTDKEGFEAGLTDIVRQRDETAEVLRIDYIGHYKKKLDAEDLWDYAIDKNNEANLVREFAEQNVDPKQRAQASVTGDEQAFKVARILADNNQLRFWDKKRAGSTVGFLNKRITANNWDASKIAAVSDDEFFNDIKDLLWSGKLRDKEKWVEFKQSVIAGDFNSLKTEIEFYGEEAANLEGLLSGKKSLAEYQGLARRIEVPPGRYQELADKYFGGNSFIQRFEMEVNRDASSVAQMKVLGSNPSAQWKQILSDAKAGVAKGLDWRNVVDRDFYKSHLEKQITGMANVAGNPTLATIGRISRKFESVTKLGGVLITQLADGVQLAGRDALITGGNVWQPLLKTYDDTAKALGIGKDSKFYKDNLASYEIGIEGALTSIRDKYRFADPELSGSTGNKFVDLIDKGLDKAFDFNGMQWFTEIREKISYAHTMNLLSRVANTKFDDLEVGYRAVLDNGNITAKEWDAIRKNALDKSPAHGDYLNPDLLKDIDRDLFIKYKAAVMRETHSMTVRADSVDQARLLRGTRPGTLAGENARFMMQFKSFPLAFMTKVVNPLRKVGRTDALVELGVISSLMATALISIRDGLSGRTPRDFTKPQNALGAVAFGLGMPVVGEVTEILTSDRVDGNTLVHTSFGPAYGDAIDTVSRAVVTGKEILSGEFDSDKAILRAGRTVLPSVPFANTPGVNIFYQPMIYNNFRATFDPRFESNMRKNAEKRGTDYWADDMLRR